MLLSQCILYATGLYLTFAFGKYNFFILGFLFGILFILFVYVKGNITVA